MGTSDVSAHVFQTTTSPASPVVKAARGLPRRAATVAAGLLLAGLGSTLAMAGVVATDYADSWDAPAPVAAMGAIEHARTLSYPMDQVWPATLRYLRVDRGYTLVDRDSEAGYILFDFPLGRPGDAEARVARGSIEMFSANDNAGRSGVRVQITTDAGPAHLPHALAEGLAVKLRAERGNPVQPPSGKSPAPPTPAPDDHKPPKIQPPIQP